MRENVDPTATADPGTPTLPSRASSHTVDRGRPRGRRPWLGTYGAAALLCAAWTAIAASLTLGGSGSPGPMMTAHPACVAMLAAGSQTVALESDGRPRDVIVHIPAAPTHQRWPAVVAFHGYSSFAMDLEVVSGLSALADDHGFVVAYPQALGSPTEWHFSGNLGG